MEVATIRDRGDEAQCIWILHDLQAKDKGVSWTKIDEEDLSARTTSTVIQFKTEALHRKTRLQTVWSHHNQRSEALWSSRTSRSCPKSTQSKLDCQWSVTERLVNAITTVILCAKWVTLAMHENHNCKQFKNCFKSFPFNISLLSHKTIPSHFLTSWIFSLAFLLY